MGRSVLSYADNAVPSHDFAKRRGDLSPPIASASSLSEGSPKAFEKILGDFEIVSL